MYWPKGQNKSTVEGQNWWITWQNLGSGTLAVNIVTWGSIWHVSVTIHFLISLFCVCMCDIYVCKLVCASVYAHVPLLELREGCWMPCAIFPWDRVSPGAWSCWFCQFSHQTLRVLLEMIPVLLGLKAYVRHAWNFILVLKSKRRPSWLHIKSSYPQWCLLSSNTCALWRWQ